MYNSWRIVDVWREACRSWTTGPALVLNLVSAVAVTASMSISSVALTNHHRSQVVWEESGGNVFVVEPVGESVLLASECSHLRTQPTIKLAGAESSNETTMAFPQAPTVLMIGSRATSDAMHIWYPRRFPQGSVPGASLARELGFRPGLVSVNDEVVFVDVVRESSPRSDPVGGRWVWLDVGQQDWPVTRCWVESHSGIHPDLLGEIVLSSLVTNLVQISPLIDPSSDLQPGASPLSSGVVRWSWAWIALVAVAGSWLIGSTTRARRAVYLLSGSSRGELLLISTMRWFIGISISCSTSMFFFAIAAKFWHLTPEGIRIGASTGLATAMTIQLAAPLEVVMYRRSQILRVLQQK